MQSKLERLLRYHRQNVFDKCDLVADRHSRALRRLRATYTFKAMCQGSEDAQRYRASERMLSLYA